MSEYLSQNIIEFSNGRDSKVKLFKDPELIQSIRYVPGENGRDPEWIDFNCDKLYLRIDVNVNPKEKRSGSIIVTTNLGEHLFDITLLDYDTTIPVYEKDPIRVCVHTTSTSVTYDKGGIIKGWVETIGADTLTCTFAYPVKIGEKTKYDAIWYRWPIEFTIPEKLDQTKTERFIYTVKGTNSNNTALCEGSLLRSKYSGNLGTDEGEDPVAPPSIEPSIEVELISPSSTVTHEGGTVQYRITTSNANSWNITYTGNFIPDKTEGTTSSDVITINVPAGDSAESRVFTFTAIGENGKTVSIKKTVSRTAINRDVVVYYGSLFEKPYPTDLDSLNRLKTGTNSFSNSVSILICNGKLSRMRFIAYPVSKVELVSWELNFNGSTIDVMDYVEELDHYISINGLDYILKYISTTSPISVSEIVTLKTI